jgi:uncharacterized protein (TIGR00255 family)
MIQSMTGFGRAEGASGGWHCAVELRSVNGRHLEFRVRMPGGLAAMEEALKRRLRERCERGKVEGSVALSADGENFGELSLNRPALERYAQLLKEVERVTHVKPLVTLGDLVNGREPVLRSAADGHAEEVEALVESTFDRAADALVAMRAHEGEALAAEFRSRIALLRGHLAAVVPLVRDLPQRQAARLREHLAKLVGLATDGNAGIGQPGRFSPAQEERIHLEIALLADRCDVSEEIARFGTHLDHIEQLIAQGGPLGRKFEFLLQELQREANTLSVKSSHPQVSARIVEIKTEIERLREQIQNVE